MANVVMSKQFSKDLEIDGSLRNRAWDFLTKLMKDPSQPGLHVEPLHRCADPRVRTGRVTDGFRAVMFLVASEPEQQFVLAAIKQHDEAIKLAERLILRVNPVSGILEIESSPDVADNANPVVVAPTRQLTEPAAGPLSFVSMSELTDVIGISPAIARAALTAASEDELLSIADAAPAWQADALLSLAVGRSPQDIADELRAAAEESAPTADVPALAIEQLPEAAAFELAYAHPASQMEFVKITDDDQLRRVVQGSFALWRVFLHPEQRRYAYRDRYNGAFRLSGGAGTGKTVVALHRARFLARSPEARIVLTTFTTTLADNLLAGLRELDAGSPIAAKLGDPGIYVAGVDKLARDALALLGQDAMRRAAPHLGSFVLSGDVVLGDSEDRRLWQEALSATGTSLAAAHRQPSFLAAEYRTVVLANNLTSREEYARVPRPGRGVRLSRAERIAIWDVVTAYRRGLEMTGKVTFAELAAIAAAALENASIELADHVIIDEAQDLHVSHWRLLRGLVRTGPNDLFICEDSHQRIYGEKVLLGRLGIVVQGRSRRLTLNYRTTAQNLKFAVAVLQGSDVTDLEGDEESTGGYRSPMFGPEPRLVHAESLTQELDTIARVMTEWLGASDVERSALAILVRSGAVRDLVQRGLADRGVSVQAVAGRNTRLANAPLLLTMHRAKGLEFRRVLLAGVDETQLPAARFTREFSDEDLVDATRRERMLLYVASSRARDELVVTWHGRPSPFLPSAGAAS